MQQSPEQAILTLVPPNTEALRLQGSELVSRAQAIKITDAVSYTAAVEELRRDVALRRSIEEAFRPPKQFQDRAHKALCKLENDLLAFPKEGERIIKAEVGRWEDEERRRRDQEQARISAELLKLEEDERLEQAEALSDAGHQEAAEALLDQPIVAPVVEIRHEKPAGISTRGKWTFRILDEKAIARAYLTPDEKKIRQVVTALGPDAVEVVGGIEVLRDTIVAVR